MDTRRGFVEVSTPHRIAGWARDPARGDAPVHVELRSGGQVLASVTAQEFRGDLRDAGFGSGHHGFTFDLEDLFAGVTSSERQFQVWASDVPGTKWWRIPGINAKPGFAERLRNWVGRSRADEDPNGIQSLIRDRDAVYATGDGFEVRARVTPGAIDVALRSDAVQNVPFVLVDGLPAGPVQGPYRAGNGDGGHEWKCLQLRGAWEAGESVSIGVFDGQRVQAAWSGHIPGGQNQTERIAKASSVETTTVRRQAVLVWKQVDAGFYGRRVDQIARMLAREMPELDVHIVEVLTDDTSAALEAKRADPMSDAAALRDLARDKQSPGVQTEDGVVLYQLRVATPQQAGAAMAAFLAAHANTCLSK
ncbi:MAG: hypothetical protein HRU32_11430 [Rhodobacteraceae bacterium]|nr:hypothetical protein [Paracoccaceae bacterium]